MAAIWRELFEVDRIGMDDNFFDLGGHSLLLVRAHERLLGAGASGSSDHGALPVPDGSFAREVSERGERRRSRRRRDEGACPEAEASARTDESREGEADSRCPTPTPTTRSRGLRSSPSPVASRARATSRSSGRTSWRDGRRSPTSPRTSSSQPSPVDMESRRRSELRARARDPRRRRAVRCGVLQDEPARGRGHRSAAARLSRDAPGRRSSAPDTTPRRTTDRSASTRACRTTPTSSRTSIRDPTCCSSAGELPMLGNEKDYLATRVSYKLNLRGPSLNIVTACSSSLVAVCQAVQALATHQCDMALAGGVSIRVPQRRGYLYQEGFITSPDGHCRAFDERAAGTVFSNGLGIVVLKRLDDAVADGDTIYAVIKGAAVNNDGSGRVSFTAPSVDGQAEAIAMAQALAGIDPDTISLRRGSWNRHGARRSRRDRRSHAGLPAGDRGDGLLRARLGEDQHRSPRRCGRRHRPDQDGARASSRTLPADDSLRDAEPRARSVEHALLRQREAVGLARAGRATARRRQLARRGRHERPCRARGGAAAQRPPQTRASSNCCCCRLGAPMRSIARRRCCARTSRPSPTSRSRTLRTPSRSAGADSIIDMRSSRRAREDAIALLESSEPARVASATGRQPAVPGRLPVPGPGSAAREHGPRSVRDRAGLPVRRSTSAPSSCARISTRTCGPSSIPRDEDAAAAQAELTQTDGHAAGAVRDRATRSPSCGSTGASRLTP